MLGNVAEWTADVYREAPSMRFETSGAASDARGRTPFVARRPQGGQMETPGRAFDASAPRVVRGGAWSSRRADCRSAFRDWARPTVKSPEIGFRAAIVRGDGGAEGVE